MISRIFKSRELITSAKIQLQYCYKMNHNSAQSYEKFQRLKISVPQQFVYMVEMNRPKKLNALDELMWKEFKSCFNEISVDPECRVVVLSGSGKQFCAGIDFQSMVSLAPKLAEHEDVARKCKILEQVIKDYQDSFTAIEKCSKPVIAAVHNACIGAGVDMISAADIRYCSSNAWFQIKEIDLGMAADVGTLQRFPKVISSDSLARELVYTGRKFSASEALQCGFVSRVFDSQEDLLKGSMELASVIASKSPVAMQASKLSLVYSRDHTVQEGLDHIALINKTMLQTEDFANATVAQATKSENPPFSKL